MNASIFKHWMEDIQDGYRTHSAPIKNMQTAGETLGQFTDGIVSYIIVIIVLVEG